MMYFETKDIVSNDILSAWKRGPKVLPCGIPVITGKKPIFFVSCHCTLNMVSESLRKDSTDKAHV